MPKYAIQYVHYVTTTSLRSVVGAYMAVTNGQAEIVEVIMTGSGSDAAADIQHRCELASYTFGATGVSTSITPLPFNPVASAALGNYGANYSTEPTTINAVHPVTFGFNQRGGMRWAVPQGEGYKLNQAATDKGATATIISSAAGNVDGSMHLWQGN